MAGGVHAQVPSDYYDTADSSSAAALRDSLNDIVSTGHWGIDFAPSSASFNALYSADQDDADSSQVRLIYTGDRRPISPNDKAADADPATGGWIREPLFPRAFFGSAEPMGGDLHHLFPVDADLGAERQAKTFDEVATPTYSDSFGVRIDAVNFEPPDDMKGDVARALFYMDVRYAGEGSEPDLTLIDSAPGGTDQNEMAYLTTLLQWHNDDPPDAFEVWRNGRIYNLQGNANPFVDHPEWVQIVYGSTAAAVTDGNTIAVSGTDLAATGILQGETDAPMLALSLTLGADEYAVGEIDVQTVGSIADGDIDRVRLWLDADASDTVTVGDTLLDAKTVASSAATLVPVAPLRLMSGTSRLLLTLSIKPAASVGETVALRVLANGLRHDTRGGADVNPTFSAITSGSSTVGDAPDSPYQSLRITEVFEGNGGSLKYVEIQNTSASSVDLDDASHDIALRLYSNGAVAPSATIDLTGTIAAGDYFVIVNNETDFDPVFGAANRDQISGSISHNGNDLYDLYDQTGAELIDAFAADRAGSTADFANDLAAFRVDAALPNTGDWGSAARPAHGAMSASGYWQVAHITAGNANAATAGTPGNGGTTPVELSEFRID